jgi:magnesium transporter
MSEAHAKRGKRSFRKARPPAGARPGTLAIPAGSPPPRIHVYRYGPGSLHEHDVADVAELARYVEPQETAWIDVRGLGDEAMLRRIGEIFGLHPLALEDAVNVPGRAKAELYPDHQLVIARLPILGEGGAIDVPQIALFIGRRHLLSFQERSFGYFDPVRERLRAGTGPMRSAGPAYLAYALLDTAIDRYYPIVEALSHALEDLEEEAVGPAADLEVLEEIHEHRRRLVVLRRIGRPQREAIRDLAYVESPFVPPEVRTFLRDTCDHVSQVIELADSAHEMATGLTEIYLSNVGQRTNEIMKVLTLVGSVFIPLSFVAGVYGMNFDEIPGIHQPWGYPLTLAGMAGVAAAMLLYFRRRGWLGGALRARPRRRRRRRSA